MRAIDAKLTTVHGFYTTPIPRHEEFSACDMKPPILVLKPPNTEHKHVTFWSTRHQTSAREEYANHELTIIAIRVPSLLPPNHDKI